MVLSLYAFLFKWLVEYLPGLWPSLGFRINGCTKVNEWRLGVWGGTVQVPWLCAAVPCLLQEPATSSALQTAQLHSRQGWDGSCRCSCHPVMGTEDRRHFCSWDTEWWDVPFLHRAALCLTWAKKPQAQRSHGHNMIPEDAGHQPVPVRGGRSKSARLFVDE